MLFWISRNISEQLLLKYFCGWYFCFVLLFFFEIDLNILSWGYSLTLVLGEWGNPPPLPSWFSLNNSKTVKTVTLNFHSIQYHFRDIRAKIGIHNSVQSQDIGQNSDERVSNFRISGQSLIKENCYNSRTIDNINMKPGPVTKLDKRNKTTSKKLTMTSCRKIAMSLSFFCFLANLETGFRTQSLQQLCFQ